MKWIAASVMAILAMGVFGIRRICQRTLLCAQACTNNTIRRLPISSFGPSGSRQSTSVPDFKKATWSMKAKRVRISTINIGDDR